MKVPKKLQTNEANLSFKELEDLAEEIRTQVSKGKAYTVREYVGAVASMDIVEFGYRKGKALLFEPKLESYFPDPVFEALHRKGREGRHHVFNEDDNAFLEKNINKGIEWLADRFYMKTFEIYGKIVELDLDDKLSSNGFDFNIIKEYEESEARKILEASVNS